MESLGVVKLILVMNANADWFPGLINWIISPLLREGSVPVGQTVLLEFVLHYCECGNCAEKFEEKNGASLEPQSCRSWMMIHQKNPI